MPPQNDHHRQKNSLLFKIRIISVQLLYVVYSVFLWLKLIDLGVATGHQKINLKIVMSVWMVAFVVCLCVTAVFGLQSSPPKFLLQTWLNFPMFVFVVFNLPPYGFTLKHMYKYLNQKAQNEWTTTMIQQQNNTINCTSPFGDTPPSIHVPMYDFILLQLVMLVMLLTFVIYPLPRRAYTYSEYIAVGVEFMNAFDTMDMISDLEFVQKYGPAWEVVFYISLGITAVLIAFPIKIDDDDIVWPQNIKITSQSSITAAPKAVGSAVDGPDGSQYSLQSILDAPVVFETDFAVQTVYTETDGNGGDNNPQTRRVGNDTTDSYLTEKNNRLSSANSISPKQQQRNENALEKPKRISTKLKKTTLERYALHFSETQKKLIKVLLTVICTDLFFAVIRYKIMIEEQSAVHGFNMFVKNMILFCLHSSYLLQHVHTLIKNKLLQDIERENNNSK